jgi:hypothetical protein
MLKRLPGGRRGDPPCSRTGGAARDLNQEGVGRSARTGARSNPGPGPRGRIPSTGSKAHPPRFLTTTFRLDHGDHRGHLGGGDLARQFPEPSPEATLACSTAREALEAPGIDQACMKQWTCGAGEAGAHSLPVAPEADGTALTNHDSVGTPVISNGKATVLFELPTGRLPAGDCRAGRAARRSQGPRIPERGLSAGFSGCPDLGLAGRWTRGQIRGRARDRPRGRVRLGGDRSPAASSRR